MQATRTATLRNDPRIDYAGLVKSSRGFAAVAGTLLLLAAATASAQPADLAAERARVHRERGLMLIESGDCDPALFEWERSFELVPDPDLLFHVGRCMRELHDYAGTRRLYERYLRHRGNAVPADRRAELEKELAVLAMRTATLTVKVDVDGVDVQLDDAPLCGRWQISPGEPECTITPSQPIVVNPGRHKVTATKRGFGTATTMVMIAQGENAEVNLPLSVPICGGPLYAKPWTSPWRLPAILGWGATVGTLAAGSATGFASVGSDSDSLSNVSLGLFAGTAGLAVASTVFTMLMDRDAWKTRPRRPPVTDDPF